MSHGYAGMSAPTCSLTQARMPGSSIRVTTRGVRDPQALLVPKLTTPARSHVPESNAFFLLIRDIGPPESPVQAFAVSPPCFQMHM